MPIPLVLQFLTMERIKNIEIRTASYTFTIDLLKEESGELVARLIGQTPPIPENCEGTIHAQYTTQEELRGGDQETLIERCRARVRELDGEILKEEDW
jgi:hypothetical protein